MNVFSLCFRDLWFCKPCDAFLPRSEFHSSALTKGMHMCRRCYNEKRKQSRQKKDEREKILSRLENRVRRMLSRHHQLYKSVDKEYLKEVVEAAYTRCSGKSAWSGEAKCLTVCATDEGSLTKENAVLLTIPESRRHDILKQVTCSL